MSRPRNNLDELTRKHGQPSLPSPTKPTTPATVPKGKFKPAKAISASVPPPNPARKLASFSTPNFGKSKPPPLNCPSAFDNNTSYVNVSSAESTPRNASSSRVPAKRLSTGAPEDVVPRVSPKRPKTSHQPDKENEFQASSSQDKGKARARDLYTPSRCSPLPALSIPSNPRLPHNATTSTLRAAFEGLPHGSGLGEKTEEELRVAASTVQELVDITNKLIGASRTGDGEPRDLEFLDLLTDLLLERRLTAIRAEIKAIQRGEPRSISRAASSDPFPFATGSSTTFTDDDWAPDPAEPSACFQAPPEPFSAGGVSSSAPSALVDSMDDDDDDEYWGSFPDTPIVTGEVAPAPEVTAPATAPTTQPWTSHATSEPSASVSSDVVTEPETLTQHADYPLVAKTLKEVFKLSAFRAKQLPAIIAAMERRDILVLFPTGSGKSLTFQLPAVCQEGVTVVVGPLISLMRDQVTALRALNIEAEQLSGTLDAAARERVRQRLRSRNKPKLLYVTPEQLQMSSWMKTTMQWLYDNKQLRRFVIDEAHCLTDWGRRFRECYPQLRELRKMYHDVPITALTATAPPEAVQDIQAGLGMVNCATFQISSNRVNLDYEVREAKCTTEQLAAIIRENHAAETGIVYCYSRQMCENVAEALRDRHGLSAEFYHAQMDRLDKERVQDDWYHDKIRVVVATVAFGMGIDKADGMRHFFVDISTTKPSPVRFVIHYTIPGSLLNYYQETGRAGRDGKPAKCLMFYQYGDFAKRLDYMRKDEIPDEEKRWQEEEFVNVQRYCRNNVECRRKQVMDYFKQDFDPKFCKRLCDNCRDNTECTFADHTEDAKIALGLLESAAEHNVWVSRQQSRDALRGSKAKLILDKGLSRYPNYGMLKLLQVNVVDRLLDEMITADVLAPVMRQNGQYSQPYLQVGYKAEDLKSGKLKINISFRDNGKAPGGPRKGRGQDNASSIAGPSSATAGPARRRGKQRAAAEDDSANKLPLYRDDPQEDDPEFLESDIEEIASPPPPARRMSTRAMPSASQAGDDNWDSDIEEVDDPPAQPRLRVTMIRKEDIQSSDNGLCPQEQCAQDLIELRKDISRDNPDLGNFMDDNFIHYISLILPDNREALDKLFSEEEGSLSHFAKYERRMVQICSKYARLTRRD